MAGHSVVLLGSFRKHWAGIADTARIFRTLGCQILSPTGQPVNPEEEFVRLDSDRDRTEAEIVRRVLDAVDRADAVYFYNPDGYLGASASVELGYCLAAGKRVYLLAEPADDGHQAFAVGRVATPEQVVADLKQLRLPERLSGRESLAALQRYVAAMVEARGFSKYSATDVMLLMVEEVGELAKALRKATGLKIDHTRSGEYHPVGEEMADVLLYLLSLANWADVDLAAVLRSKEEQNDRRIWKA